MSTKASARMARWYGDMQVRVVIWQGVPAVQSTVFDITERKQSEEAMRHSEERFRHLVEGSIQGIMLHRDGKPIFANQAYAEMYGYDSPEDILGWRTSSKTSLHPRIVRDCSTISRHVCGVNRATPLYLSRCPQRWHLYLGR